MKLQEICDYYGNLFINAIVDEAKKIAKENPDFVYRTLVLGTDGKCFYNKGSQGGPECDGCLIGQALQRLGWDDSFEMGFFGPIQELISEYTNHVFDGGEQTLRWMQERQDSGRPWGECV